MKEQAAGTDGFAEFVAGQGAVLLRFAYLLTGDRVHAEDILQSALEKSYRHWRRVSAMGAPEAYIRRALVNGATDRWRRLGRRPEVPLAAGAQVASPEAFSGVDDRDALVRALRVLPARQRAIVVLRYCDDRSEAEVAALLDCSLGTVKSQASRGLARLRGLLADFPHYTGSLL